MHLRFWTVFVMGLVGLSLIVPVQADTPDEERLAVAGTASTSRSGIGQDGLVASARDPRPPLRDPQPLQWASGFRANWTTYSERRAEKALYCVDWTLRRHRPSDLFPATPERALCLSVQDEVLNYYEEWDAARSPSVKTFYLSRMQAALAEMQSMAKMTGGCVVWKLYNMGFVVRTADGTVAFDLVRGLDPGNATVQETLGAIVDQCDVLFVSHNDPDHADPWVKQRFVGQGKPVIAPADTFSGAAGITRLPRDGSLQTVVSGRSGRRFGVRVLPGHQGAQENNLVLVTSGGLDFAHAGDQESASDLSWIATIKSKLRVDALMAPNRHGFVHELIGGTGARSLFMGHENVLSEIGVARRGYFHSRWIGVRSAAALNVPLSWGESWYGNPAAAKPPPADRRRCVPPAPPINPNPGNYLASFEACQSRKHEYAFHDLDIVERTVGPMPVSDKNFPGYPEVAPDRLLRLMALDCIFHHHHDDDRYWQSGNGVWSAGPYYRRRLEAVLWRLNNTRPGPGQIQIFRLYNLGFIVRTQAITLAFDVINVFADSGHRDTGNEIRNLTRQILARCDGLFISHSHGDHYQQEILDHMRALRRSVFGPQDVVRQGGVAPNRDGNLYPVSINGKAGRMRVYPVEHGAGNCYVIHTPDRMVVGHTGDFMSGNLGKYYKESVLTRDPVDVMLMRQWGRRWRPKLCVIGHELEVGHRKTSRIGYFQYHDEIFNEYKRDGRIPYLQMGIGAGYTYDRNARDGQPPSEPLPGPADEGMGTGDGSGQVVAVPAGSVATPPRPPAIDVSRHPFELTRSYLQESKLLFEASTRIVVQMKTLLVKLQTTTLSLAERRALWREVLALEARKRQLYQKYKSFEKAWLESVLRPGALRPTPEQKELLDRLLAEMKAGYRELCAADQDMRRAAETALIPAIVEPAPQEVAGEVAEPPTASGSEALPLAGVAQQRMKVSETPGDAAPVLESGAATDGGDRDGF